jgi:hypothetical protein
METSDCRRLYLASEAEGALACVVKPHVGVRTVVGVFCSRLRVSITLDLGRMPLVCCFGFRSEVESRVIPRTGVRQKSARKVWLRSSLE